MMASWASLARDGKLVGAAWPLFNETSQAGALIDDPPLHSEEYRVPFSWLWTEVLYGM